MRSPRALQPGHDRRVVDGHVVLEDLRAGGRRDALRADHVLDRDRDRRAPPRLSQTVEERVQLGVALADRGGVGGEELVRRRPRRGRAGPRRLLRAQPQGVQRHPDLMPGGTLKRSPPRSGAFANASSSDRRRPRLVLAPDVDDVERVRGRRHVREVELLHLRDRLEDRRELLAEALDLRLGELEPRQPRDVQHLVSGNRHTVNPSKKRAPFRGPSPAGSER